MYENRVVVLKFTFQTRNCAHVI